MSSGAIPLPSLNTVERYQLEGRFWSKVSHEDSGCWRWNAGLYTRGYGCFHVEGKPQYAHRVSFSLYYGAVPLGAVICHSCDNVWCVNPRHLFAGTQAENLADMAAKGRSTLGEKNPRSKLNALEVAAIRQMYGSSGLTQHAIAELFGVQRTAVSRIITGARWGTN